MNAQSFSWCLLAVTAGSLASSNLGAQTVDDTGSNLRLEWEQTKQPGLLMNAPQIDSVLAAEPPQTTKTHRLQPPIATGLQSGRELKLSAGLATYVEGMALALLGGCSVRGEENKEAWSNALKSDHLKITYPKPRPVGVSSGGEDEVLEVSEILLPMSDRQLPEGILVHCGARYQRYGKYWPLEAIRLQNLLKGLKEARR
jgi:hypothetical protein